MPDITPKNRITAPIAARYGRAVRNPLRNPTAPTTNAATAATAKMTGPANARPRIVRMMPFGILQLPWQVAKKPTTARNGVANTKIKTANNR